MNNKTLILFFHVIFALSSHNAYSQVAKPANWNEIIKNPWYQGTVDGKPAFVYLDQNQLANGYFFIAYNAVPNIYQLVIKWKNDDPRSVIFRMQGKKIRAKFKGSLQDKTIDGMIKISRRNARRLNIPNELPLILTLERPVIAPTLTHRYITPIFKWVDLSSDISYGAASGYYVRDLQGLRLDLYQPTGDALTNRPLILLMHGGAFIMGDKATTTVGELAENFARKGYVVAVINYRMGFNPASKSSLERSGPKAPGVISGNFKRTWAGWTKAPLPI